MDPRELVQAYFDRLNAEDWDGLAELFHPEAELEAPAFRARRAANRSPPTFALHSASIRSTTTIPSA